MKKYDSNIFLHACCGPCSTVALKRLEDKPVIFWFNPNIEPFSEHQKRLETLQSLCDQTGTEILDYQYDYKTENLKWHKFIAGLENESEGGERCRKCFQFRFEKLKELALENQFEEATTTLTVSPHKNSKDINAIGGKIFDSSNVKFLELDLKKQNGYLESIELSKEAKLYRQDYCGCLFSKNRTKNS